MTKARLGIGCARRSSACLPRTARGPCAVSFAVRSGGLRLTRVRKVIKKRLQPMATSLADAFQRPR